MQWLERLVLAAAVLAIPGGPLVAQVNTERLRSGAEEPGFGAAFDVSFALRDGNSDTLSLGTGLRLRHSVTRSVAAPDGEVDEVSHRLAFLVADYSFSEQDGERGANRFFTHLRWVRHHGSRLAVEAFAQHQFDEFQRLETRLLAGFGGRIELLPGEDLDVFLGSGYMFEFEHLDVPPDGPDARETRHHRWTSYLTVRYEEGDGRLALVSTLYLQPRFDRLDDYRILEEAELQVKLAGRLSFGLAASVRYDSDPPAGVEATDLALTNKLRFEF